MENPWSLLVVFVNNCVVNRSNHDTKYKLPNITYRSNKNIIYKLYNEKHKTCQDAKFAKKIGFEGFNI